MTDTDQVRVTITQAAKRSGFHRNTIRNRIKQDVFKTARLETGPKGEQWLIDQDEVDRLLGVADKPAQVTETAREGPTVGDPSSIPNGYALVPLSVAEAMSRVLDMLPGMQEGAQALGRVEQERDTYRQRLDAAREATRAAETERDRFARENATLRIRLGEVPADELLPAATATADAEVTTEPADPGTLLDRVVRWWSR